MTIRENPSGITGSRRHPTRPAGDGLDFQFSGDIAVVAHGIKMIEAVNHCERR
jgi:hypothetical protein